MGNILKKIFSSFVALTTIAWSVGIGTMALPTAARAATAGDLIKASGPAVYYYAADGKRYVFPNEKTYFSWFVDFSGVRTISDTELASYLIGGNATIRPGTRLVKIQTDPKVYAVTLGGVLHWVESEAIAISLYGATWAQRVVDVPDSFFVNYTIGSSVSTAVHPSGTVVQYAGSTTRYVVDGGQKRMIASDAVYAANGFNPAFAITTSITYPDHASNVNSRECALADVIAICGVIPVGGNLVVSLASDTPPAQTVPKNAASISMAKFNLTAGSAAALVTGLQIRRIGVGATSDFSNVYLYDGNGNRLTTGRTINSSTNVVEFHGLSINVAAGATYSLVMVGDFSSPSATGGQHAFEISAASSVVISGSGTVSGSFPVRGNVFTVGTTAAGRLDVQKGTTPANPNIGAQNAEISNFKLTANTNDIEVRRLTLLQAGSVTNSDLTKFELWTGTTKVAETAATVGDKIVLNFEPPYVIPNGTTKTLSLKAAIAGRASRTIKTYVEYTTDVYAIDRLYSAGAAVCIADTAVGGCTTTGQGSFDGESTDSNYIEVTTQGGQLTVSFNGPTTGNVAKGSQDVVLYRFSLASPDNTLEIRNVDFKIQGNTSSDLVIGSAGTEYFRDIKIKNLATGAIWMGPTTFPTTCADGAQGSASTCLITLSDSRNINAGEVLDLAITADLHNGAEDATNEFYADGNNQYKVVHGDSSSLLFDSDDVRVVSTGEFLAVSKIVPNTSITSNLQTVKAASLSVALAASPSAGTAVKKQVDIPVVGFVFTSGNQNAIKITRVTLTGQGSLNGLSYGATNTVNIVTSCALFDGGLQVGVSASPDTTAGTFAITNMNVTVPAGSSKTLVAKCTADSVVDGAADYIAVGIDADADVTAEDNEANSVTASRSTQVDSNASTSPVLAQTIRSAGTLTIATDNLRQSTILVGDDGAIWQNFAQFKATAQYEAVELSKFTVTSTGVAANFIAQGIAIAQDGAVKGSGTLPSGVDVSQNVDLSTPIVVPKDGSATFQVWGKLSRTMASSTVSGSTSAARSGNLMNLGIGGNLQTGDWNSNYASQLNILANGQASGDRLYATTTAGSNKGTSGNQFVLRKSKPVVARQALSTTTLTAGLDTDLYKFQVSADSAGSVALKKISFSWSKGDSNSSLNFQNLRLRKGTTDIASGDLTITSATSINYYAGGPALGETSGTIVIVFTNEETVSGSGSVYTLHGTINGTVDSGDSLSFNFRRNGLATPITGYLSTYPLAGVVGSNIDVGTTPLAGAPTVVGTFVWSDLSEVPHSYASGTDSGSRDWTEDLHVEDLTQQSTLSR
ncbi:MAG: hypothetical protein AAB668_00510 [Patescibacteria group bacterium]